jgi:hypothetical protein
MMALQPRATTTPTPFSYAPSQQFEGNDGSWSTFVLRVGTPEQVFHVLISTAGQEIWVPPADGCLPTDPSNCGALRGVYPFQNQASGGFQSESVCFLFIRDLLIVNADGFQSSTWVPAGPSNLYPLSLEDPLNYTGNGYYGYDTVGLQLPNSDGISLTHQIVSGAKSPIFESEAKGNRN